MHNKQNEIRRPKHSVIKRFDPYTSVPIDSLESLEKWQNTRPDPVSSETYVPYGSLGTVSAQRQKEQDDKSSNISAGLLSKRVKSKSSSFYSNAKWDLVDALNEGEVDEDALVSMEEAALPEPMKGMSAEDKRDYVTGKAEERKKINQEISELSRSRDAFVAEKKREQIAASPSMSDALTNAVKNQAEQKNFVFGK